MILSKYETVPLLRFSSIFDSLEGLGMCPEKHLNFRNMGLLPSVPQEMPFCKRTKQEQPVLSNPVHAKVPMKSACLKVLLK